MTVKIEIVTHCLATKYEHFASALCYQLSSLVKSEIQCRVLPVVCCVPNDDRTKQVLQHFRKLMPIKVISATNEGILGRRAILRNLAAKTSKADLVWFCDADHVFLDGVLDRLALLEWPEGASMIYPREIMIHKDHSTGDQACRRIAFSDEAIVTGTGPRVVHLNPSEFVPKEYNRAIGGVQIVRGDFARRFGYLDGDEAWQKPAEVPFGDFRDDVAYRRFCEAKGPIVAVDLPGVHRVRHSETSYQEPKT